MRAIGLHLRVTHSIMDVVAYAQKLDIPIFQCFLVDQSNRKPLSIDTQMAHQFKMQSANKKLYVHGSYWINLAQQKKNGLVILRNEINQAKQLGSNNIILHPGSSAPTVSHMQGIDTVAHLLNQVMAEEPSITFILENTAHARRTVGSNLDDFYHIKQKIMYPERVKFCIDTAHAHAYGYTITTPDGQDDFIAMLDTKIGIDAIELIHLNDSAYPLSSKIDKHSEIGAGTIGQQALKSFALHPRLATIPLILELPILSQADDNDILQMIRRWHTR